MVISTLVPSVVPSDTHSCPPAMKKNRSPMEVKSEGVPLSPFFRAVAPGPGGGTAPGASAGAGRGTAAAGGRQVIVVSRISGGTTGVGWGVGMQGTSW